MRKLIALTIVNAWLFANTFAQDFSNKGKEFWVAYTNHVGMFSGQLPTMTLYITSDETTSYTVEAYGAATIQTGTINAGQVVPVIVPINYILNDEGLYNGRAIRVTTAKDAVVYAYITRSAVSGATVCLPTNVLGKDYISVNYTQVSNEANSHSYFTIVAVEDNTTVKITPAGNTKNGWPAGVEQTITLNKGKIYQVLGALTSNNTGVDLTGSIIKSVASGTEGCKRIAVFSGSGKISIGCATPGSSDNLFQQLYPTVSWGQRYLTVPSYNRVNNFFRIIRQSSSTRVFINGLEIPSGSFINGVYYQFQSNVPNYITASEPICVAQYFTTAGCSGNVNPYDPDMIILNPIEQNIKNVTLVSSNLIAANPQHHIHVIMSNKGTGISSFRFDGNPIPQSRWNVHPGNPEYSYLYLNNVTQGYHTIQSDSGFNALAYGYANAESYGYSAGANVKDLYQFLTIRNQYSSVDFPATCTGTPFYFSITLPYQPTKMVWNFGNLFSSVINNSPVADSTYTLQDKQLYVYRLPDPYQINQKGNYPIEVLVNNPTPDGCSGEQLIKFDLGVFDPPTTTFNISGNGCVGSPVQFTAVNNTGGRPVAKYYWDFGDGETSNTSNPQHTYTQPGKYTVKYVVITDVGCISDTIYKEIEVTNVPVPGFNISQPQCANKSITFNDATVFNGYGTIVEWRWDLGNGNVITNNSNTSVSTQYANAQTYNATLQVTTSTGCVSPVFSLPIKVNPIPVPNFSMSYACLPDGSVQFTNLSTIDDGTQAQLSYRWDFGNPASGSANTSNLPNPVHQYSTVGPYNIKLIVTSVNGCVDSVSKQQSNIYPQPKTNFTLPTEVCFKTPVTLQDQTNGITHPVNRWEWRFRNEAGTLVGSTSEQNPVFNFPSPGTYKVQHWAFTNQDCVSDTVEKEIVIHPWPTANFNLANPACEQNASTLNDASVANVGNLVRWYWNLGDGTIVQQNALAPVSHTYAKWGDKTVKLVVENSKGCISDTLTRSIRIHPLPKPGFVQPEVCLSDALAIFTDTTRIADGSNAFTYQWRFNAGAVPVSPGPVPATGTAQNPAVKYNKADNYTVALVVTSATGCVDSVAKMFTVNGSIPKADFEILPTNGLCSNRPVEIRNKSTVDFGNVTKVEIYWDIDNRPNDFVTDEEPMPDKIYTHQYPDFQTPLTRNFRIRFRAYSGGTCVDDEIKTITLNASPLTQFNAMPGICLDAAPRPITEAAELGGLAGNGVFTGPGVSTTGLLNPAAAGVGTHTIRYTFNAANGCTIFSEQTVEVWPRPVADFSQQLPSCEKNAVFFTDNSTHNASALTSWIWNFGDGSPVLTETNRTTVQHTYTAYNNYDVTLQVVNDRGCTSVPVTKRYAVHPLPRVDFSVPIVCLPEGRAAFTDLSTIPDNTASQFRYRWKFGDPQANPTGSDTSVLKNPVYNYRNLGTYTVRLVVTSGNNCVDSLDKQVTEVYPQPRAAFSSIDSLCIGDAVAFTDRSSGSGRSITQWHWNFGDGNHSSLQNPTYLYRNAGAYNASLYVITDKGCVSDTAEKLINVWDYPVVNAGPDLTVLQDGIRQISDARATGQGLQFLWTPPTWLNDTRIQNPTIVRPQDDITYRLTVTGRGGCTRYDEVFVKILKTPKPPNTFTPNGDGINDFWEISYLNDYPGCVIEVYNTAGTLVYRSVGYATPWDGTFKGQKLPAGTYYYVIDPKNGRSRIAGYVTIIR